MGFGGREHTQATPFEVYYYGIKAIAYRDVELKDVFGAQPLPVPAGWKPGTMTRVVGWDEHGKEILSVEDAPRFVAIQILSVYPGSKYQDCCISEISD